MAQAAIKMMLVTSVLRTSWTTDYSTEISSLSKLKVLI